jgi:hypothetical protein
MKKKRKKRTKTLNKRCYDHAAHTKPRPSHIKKKKVRQKGKAEEVYNRVPSRRNRKQVRVWGNS